MPGDVEAGNKDRRARACLSLLPFLPMKRGVLQAGRAAIASRVAPPPAAVTAPPKMYALKRKAPVRRAPSVVCEGKDWLVLNKPSNTALQGAHGTTARRNWDELLQGERWAQGLCPTLQTDAARPADIQQRAESPEVYPVHRLDKVSRPLPVHTPFLD